MEILDFQPRNRPTAEKPARIRPTVKKEVLLYQVTLSFFLI